MNRIFLTGDIHGHHSFDKIIESATFKEFYCGHWHEEIDSGKYHVLYNRIVEIK